MNADLQKKLGIQQRLEELRRGKSQRGPAEGEVATAEREEAGGLPDAYSKVSPDRQQKLMLELRLQTGNAKAIAYCYLVSIDLDVDKGIVLDFTAYQVTIEGRNLRPLFTGLLCQRIACVQEVDPLHAAALAGEDDPVVTRILIEKNGAAGP